MANLQNPFPIQSSTSAPTGSIPLVLIHDGGGTIVSYTMIGPLGRALHGIHNPKFYQGGHWDGGYPEMASHYTSLIRTLVPSGPFLLGGWSLGGILSVQIAHNLAQDAARTGLPERERNPRRLLGIVMIDSPCMIASRRASGGALKAVAGTPVFHAATNAETRARVTQCMRNSGEMGRSFKLPRWGGDELGDAAVEAVAAESRGVGVPPPVVLIRCKERVPMPEGSEPEAMSRVDVSRGSRTLGWEEYWRRDQFVSRVLETEGHHYNVFWPQYLDGVTKQISTAVDFLIEEDGKR